MRQAVSGTPNLYAATGRKYLTGAERRRFSKAADTASPRVRLFCLVLMWSGGRLSETLALSPAAIDLELGTASIETLPRQVLHELDHVFGLRAAQRDPSRARRPLWPWSRTTGWRHVKQVMKIAGIAGACAMPKGLRHAFGVAAFQTKVPPHLIQRWLGHASFRTTAIYGDVIGREERLIAARMWRI
jgi:integrase